MYSTNSNSPKNVDKKKIHEIKRRKTNENTNDIRTRPIKNKEHLLYKYSKQIPLAEAILLNDWPIFLQIGDGKPILTEKIELETITLLPPSISSCLSKEYVFSSKSEIESYIQRAKKQTMDSLFYQVKGMWKKYFDIDDDTINICAADTIFTYFQDKLGMTHYLLFIGDNNTGKSNALTLFEQLAYRPLKDISISPANIYNFLGQFEEGQGIILEDEIDNIEEQEEKMRIYKVGYTKGAKVTRMYDTSSGGTTKAKEQKRYNTYCFKAYSSEKQPTFYKAKGFIERIFTIKCSSGTPQYDIMEVINDAGEPRYKKLFRELNDLRKLLLIYRILNYDKPIPDLDLTVKNRDKQLCKPLVRLFQNSNVIDEILKSLTNFISEKRNKKLDSFDSFLYSLVMDLAKDNNSYQVSNEDIWKVICELPGNMIPNRPQSYQTDEFGFVSKTNISKICEDKFGARKLHDGKQRLLKFDDEVLKKLAVNYSPSKQIEIIRKQAPNTSNAFNTFWKNVDEFNNEKRKRSVSDSVDLRQLSPENHQNNQKIVQIAPAKTISILEKQEAGFNKALKSLEVLERQKEIERKIKERDLYRKWSGSDTWACPNCNDSGDKFYMVDHICRMNKKK